MLQAGNYPVSRELLVDLTRIRAPEGQHDLIREPAGAHLNYNWTLHFHSEPSVTGYDGALFSADINGQEHYFIFHQGTNDVKDFPSILHLANNKTPIQHNDACRFSERAMEFIAKQHPEEDVPIVQVGYSLGGALAITVCKEDQPVIAFESPGTLGVIHGQGRDAEKIGSHVLEILSPNANLINSHCVHVGSVLVPGEQDWKTDRYSIPDFMRMTSASHHISDVGDRLERAEKLEPVPARQAKWPDTAFAAFQHYLDGAEIDKSMRLAMLDKFNDLMVASRLDHVVTRGALMVGDEVAQFLAEQIYGEEAVRVAKANDEHRRKEAEEGCKCHSQPKAMEAEPVANLDTPKPRFAERIGAQKAQPGKSPAR